MLKKSKRKAKKELPKEDVYGIISHARLMKDEVVIIKSKARKHCTEVDGMSNEEFDEHWDFNIAGSKGMFQYSVVDDEFDREMLDELIDNDEAREIINPRAMTDAEAEAEAKG